MRVVEAARLITTGRLSPEIVWDITSTPERVTIALLCGRTDFLPQKASTPTTAWNEMDTRYRNLVLRRAPAHIRRCLPGYVPQPFSLSLKERLSTKKEPEISEKIIADKN